MRIAVVGGTGTLGRAVVARLEAAGHEALPLGRHTPTPVDLTTGAGLRAALEGCAAVVDASNAQRAAGETLVEGSRRLLAAEREAGVGHHVGITIVGCHEVPMAYYRHKVAQEAVVAAGPVPWTLVRATQFHDLPDAVFGAAARYGVLPLVAGRLQSVAVDEVAAVVADVATGAPRGGEVVVAGPRVDDLRELARGWHRATGRGRVPLRLPLPGKAGRAVRAGALTAPDPDVRGTVTFEQWVAARVAARGVARP